MTANEIMQLIQSLIWLLAGVGVFIVGMNFLSEALEKSAGEGMKRMLGRCLKRENCPQRTIINFTIRR